MSINSSLSLSNSESSKKPIMPSLISSNWWVRPSASTRNCAIFALAFPASRHLARRVLIRVFFPFTSVFPSNPFPSSSASLVPRPSVYKPSDLASRDHCRYYVSLSSGSKYETVCIVGHESALSNRSEECGRMRRYEPVRGWRDRSFGIDRRGILTRACRFRRGHVTDLLKICSTYYGTPTCQWNNSHVVLISCSVRRSVWGRAFLTARNASLDTLFETDVALRINYSRFTRMIRLPMQSRDVNKRWLISFAIITKTEFLKCKIFSFQPNFLRHSSLVSFFSLLWMKKRGKMNDARNCAKKEMT